MTKSDIAIQPYVDSKGYPEEPQDSSGILVCIPLMKGFGKPIEIGRITLLNKYINIFQSKDPEIQNEIPYEIIYAKFDYVNAPLTLIMLNKHTKGIVLGSKISSTAPTIAPGLNLSPEEKHILIEMLYATHERVIESKFKFNLKKKKND